MHVEALEDLVAVSEAGGFSQAADVRGVTQPTLSRRDAALEAWAGASLVDRDTHRVRLTAAGAALLDHARDALRSLEAGRRAATDAALANACAIHLCSTHMLASTFLPDWFADLEARLSPAPSLHLTVDDMRAGERVLRRGQSQLLLCHHADGVPSIATERGFRRVALGQDRLVPVIGAAAMPVGKETVPFLAYREESGLGRILAASGALDRVPKLQPVLHSHAALTLARFARQGRGLAWLPLSLVTADLGSGMLVAPFGQHEEVPVEVCLIRPSARQSKIVEQLWQAVANRAEESRGSID